MKVSDHVGDDAYLAEGAGSNIAIARDEHLKATRTQTGEAHRSPPLRCPRVRVHGSASANKPVEKLGNL